MAEFELSVTYKTLPNKVGFAIMCVLAPVWSLLVPILLGLFIGYVSTHASMVSWSATILVGVFLMAVVFAGVLMSALAEDNRVFVSKDGIAFPLFMLPALKFRRNKSWSELREANLLSSSQDPVGILHLRFDSGSTTIKLSGVSVQDQEQLLLAIELWGHDCQRSADLIAYQNRLQDEIRGVQQLSYTQMWEEELGRRFTATSFVPLEPDHKLKDGHLTILKQLAFGGLSAIYQAQKDNSEVVVLKEAVIPQNADPTERAQAEKRIAKESQILIKLRHPNIARVLDYFVEENRHYLLLEYVNGQDLRQLVKQNGAQPEEKVLEWTRQIVDIVEYLHSQDPPIIHRDLTPDNLVLRNDGTIVLIDFGAANEFIGQATGTLVGKQAYMAPEQLRGKAVLQSDLYSLGGTLFYLLTGRDPTPLSVSSPRKVLPGISELLDELVRALTGFEVEDRVGTAAAVYARLNAMSGNAPSDETPKVDATAASIGGSTADE
jgi:Serine/threonine protein kinase